MDRLRALEVFVEVVRQEGFARAAEALDTSPANVTRYVGDLEAYLHTRLLNRSSRKMSLTPSGEALYERARAILEEVAEAEAVASQAALKPRGLLRVNVPVSFGLLHLAPLWPGFLTRYPEVQLEVTLNDRMVDIVEEGYDLAIRVARGATGDMVARKLAVSRTIACAAPAYLERRGLPQAPADLMQHDCIAYTNSSHPTQWPFIAPDGKPAMARLRPVMLTNNGDTARAAALAGLGIVAQPAFLVGADLQQGTLRPVLPEYRLPELDVLAVYPSRRQLSAKVRVLIDFLLEAFSPAPPWDR